MATRPAMSRAMLAAHRCCRCSSLPSIVTGTLSLQGGSDRTGGAQKSIPWPRFHSTASNASAAVAAPSSPPPMTLRNLSKPFLLLCHPDKIPASSPDLREVNLRATQTLNGLIDAVEEIYRQSVLDHPPSSGGKAEIRARYAVEFLVPSDADRGLKGKKRSRKIGLRARDRMYTRREVVVTFPRALREGMDTVDGRGRTPARVAEAVRKRAAEEIVRLLRAAGAVVPLGATNLGRSDEGGYERRDALMEEVGLSEMETGGRYPFADRARFSSSLFKQRGQRSETPYEKSRRKFMDSVDWKEHRRRMDRAYEDARADLATQGLVRNSEERREQLISDILSRVSIDPQHDVKANSQRDQHSPVDHRTDEEMGLDPLHQLIAFRRLSLLLGDNFDELQMETMGRLWENLTIVLTPARDGQPSPSRDADGNIIVESSSAYGIPRRRNPMVAARDSGFKFTYGGDGDVTAHMPVDFTDDELLSQMNCNVWDYMNICGDGLEDLYPPHFMPDA